MAFQRPTVFAGSARDNLRAADGTLDEGATSVLEAPAQVHRIADRSIRINAGKVAA